MRFYFLAAFQRCDYFDDADDAATHIYYAAIDTPYCHLLPRCRISMLMMFSLMLFFDTPLRHAMIFSLFAAADADAAVSFADALPDAACAPCYFFVIFFSRRFSIFFLSAADFRHAVAIISFFSPFSPLISARYDAAFC